MLASLLSSGLALPDSAPPLAATGTETRLTVKAAVTPAHGEELRVDLLVDEDAMVAQGQPLLRLRATPGISLVAPMAARVARIELNPGHKLSQIVLFHESGGDRHEFHSADGREGLRRLLQGSGLWRAFRSRPFGRMPRAEETPAAIFVMLADSRPGAPAPLQAIAGREEDFLRGLDALARLTDAPCFLCAPKDRPCPTGIPAHVKRLYIARTHPQGLAGLAIHRHFPARIEAPVWDIHAEDITDLGGLLATGHLPETRLVAITGNALREQRLVRCQQGADLRGLSQPLLRPGPHDLLSGSMLDGRAAHWLAPRDRQLTVLTRETTPKRQHWFGAALERAARHAPIIPTMALDQAFGGALPPAALVRCLACADSESFVRLGGLSLVEEDLALADYVTGARPRLANQLRAMLNRIADEEDAR